jgi:hypothetical protein
MKVWLQAFGEVFVEFFSSLIEIMIVLAIIVSIVAVIAPKKGDGPAPVENCKGVQTR